jgi:hypothetical protein
MSHQLKASFVVACMAILTVTCGDGAGKQEEASRDGARQIEKGAEQVQKAAEQSENGAQQMAKGLEAMAKGLTAFAGGDPNAKPVDPVSFRDLQTVFPDLAGWEKGKPTGERMSTPVNFSEASVKYRKGEAQLELKVTDSALNQLFIAPIAMFLTTGYEKETENGYEKSVAVGEFPGWEKWNTAGKDGELNAIVNRRFIVQIEGRNIDGPKVMHTLMSDVNLKNLADLK